MMKNRWKQRGFALMIALALALPAAVLAEAPLSENEAYLDEAEGDDFVIVAEAVDQVCESCEADLADLTIDGGGATAEEDASVDTSTPESGTSESEMPGAEAPGEEPAPETEVSGNDPAPETEAPEEVPETEPSGEEPAPEAAASGEKPDAEPKPSVEENDAEPKAVSGDEPDAEPEPAGAESGAEPEQPGNESEAGQEPAGEEPGAGQEPSGDENDAGEEKSDAEEAEKPEGDAESKETTASEEAAAQGVQTSTETNTEHNAAETVVEQEDTSAKVEAVAEAQAEGASTLAFPTATLRMGKGERTQLATQIPANVTVTYSSSKPKVVKVDGTGVLRAIKKGTAVITATGSNGEKATCKVKVVKAPSKVKLNRKKMTFGLGESRALTAKLPKGSASAITWTSSNPAVAAVDAAGTLQGVGAGKATITARTFNGKKARCTVTVLGGRTPTSLTFPSKTISLGLKEKRQLTPQLGAGEAAIFTYSSSKKSVVSITRGGWMTAKKKGTAKITVKTHNGLKCKLTVKVIKAPSKLTMSKANVSLEAGKAAKLTAKLPSNTASAITWTSSDPNIATVDANGNVQAVNPGTVQITASTFNGKSATCTVVVTQVNPDNVPPALSNAQMIANLRNSSALGGKKDAICSVAEMMLNAGFEPTFVAGLCANVYSEGTYGFFESSKYVSNYQKRPKYFCYLDGGEHYTLSNGKYVVDSVYLAPGTSSTYGPEVKVYDRYGDEKYYWNKWSGQYVYKINLNELEAFMEDLAAKKWVGKFGLGVTQWTGNRTRRLMVFYRKYAGQGNPTITKEQVIAAENEMILYDLQGDYKKVHTEWKNTNEKALYGANAAYSAGSLLCLKYEIPANKTESAVKRGNNASKFYKIMIGAT